MASIYKVARSNGQGYRWRAEIRRTGHRPIKKTFDLKSDAQAWAQQQESLILAKRYRDPRLAQMFMLADALEKYLSEGVIKGKAASTLGREKYSRAHLERLLGGDTALADIRPHHVNTYQNARLQEGASRSSVRQELAMLSKMFTTARRAWQIPVDNPVNDVERIAPGPSRERFLTTEEAAAVLAEAKKSVNPGFYPFVLLLMHTGMRTGEAARLHEQSVNLTARSVVIAKTKSGRPRSVPLTKQVVAALETVEPVGGYYFLRPKHLKSERIMLQPGMIFRECWKNLFSRLEKREDITVPTFRPHDLRHTAASHLLMAGVDARIIADILGHSTLQMVMRYTHLLDSHRQSVVDKIAYLGMEAEDADEEGWAS